MADELFSESVMVRFSPEARKALNEGARLQGSKPAQYARHAVMAQLKRDGLYPPADQQFALVARGEVVMQRDGQAVTTFRPEPSDRGEWLPIVNEDSAPVDPDKHWRLAPLPLRVEGSRVVRTYPVVVKSLEFA